MMPCLGSFLNIFLVCSFYSHDRGLGVVSCSGLADLNFLGLSLDV